MLCTAIVALLAAASSVSSAATVYPTFNLIKDDRDAGRFVFMPNTPAQREVVLSNAESILNVWFKAGDGANDFGGQRTTLDFLGTIYGSINRLPTNDHITLQFKARAKYNRIYTVKVPYVSGHNNACWTLSSNMYKGLTNITLPGTPILPSHMMPTHHDYERQLQIDAIREKKFPKGKQINHEEFTEARNSIFPQKADAALAFHPANVTTTTVGPLSIKAEVAGIEEITVFKADGKTVAGQQTISPSDRNIQIEAPPVINGLGYSRITLVGKTAGKQVVKTYRNIRYIPKTSDFIPLVANPFTFSDITPAVGIYNGPQTLAASGWNKSGKYIIGNGIKYADNVDSSIEAFFTAPVSTHINIDLDLNLNSEPDYDFIYLTVNSMDGAKDFLLSSIGTDNKTVFNGVSGLNTTVKGVFPYVTKNEQFSVSLQFTSDGAVEFSGATINSFKINAQPSTTFRKEHGHSGRRAE
ncbi:hypothetical protein BDV3_003733 [Batrachochytrium dendrobatidis]